MGGVGDCDSQSLHTSCRFAYILGHSNARQLTNGPKSLKISSAIATVGIALALMIAVSVSRVALAAPGLAPGVVAITDGQAISTHTFDHWMRVAAKSANRSTPGKPVIVPTDPPTFRACVRQARSQWPSLRSKPETMIQSDCLQLFNELSAQVMDFLVKADWYVADAQRLGIFVTTEQVNATYAHDLKTNYPTAAEYRAFLAKTWQTAADIGLRVRLNLIYKALVKKVGRANAVNAEASRLYRPGTICSPDYVMDDCAPRQAPSPSPTEQVRSAWSQLRDAMVAGNPSGICAGLSDQARAELLAVVSAITPASTCEAAARTWSDVARNTRAQLAGAKLTSVSVHGNNATTTDTTGPPSDEWIKVQGAWELAQLPSS